MFFKYFEDFVSVNCKFESIVIVLEEVKWLVLDFEVCMCFIIEMMLVYIVYVGLDYRYIYLNRCLLLVMSGWLCNIVGMLINEMFGEFVYVCFELYFEMVFGGDLLVFEFID